MMRKQLGSPEDLDVMPSYLGRVFRLAYYGYDSFDYAKWIDVATDEERDSAWNKCRSQLGMHSVPDEDYDREHRQQFTTHHLPA